MDEKYEYDAKPAETLIWGFIIGAGFIIWGTYTLINELGTINFFPWWTLIAWGIGLSIIFSNVRKVTQRSKILNLVETAIANYERISIGQLSNETNVHGKSIKYILADLRLKGRLIAKFLRFFSLIHTFTQFLKSKINCVVRG